MEPFTLTVRDVKRSAREAHKAKRLIAQHDGGRARFLMVLDGRECVCAVAAALPKATLDRIAVTPLNRLSFTHPDFDEHFRLPTGIGWKKIQEIEIAHDRWAEAAPEDRVVLEAEFMSLIE